MSSDPLAHRPDSRRPHVEWRDGEIERSHLLGGPVAHGFRTITTDEVGRRTVVEPVTDAAKATTPTVPNWLFTPVTHARPMRQAHSSGSPEGDRSTAARVAAFEPVKLRACGAAGMAARTVGSATPRPGPGPDRAV